MAAAGHSKKNGLLPQVNQVYVASTSGGGAHAGLGLNHEVQLGAVSARLIEEPVSLGRQLLGHVVLGQSPLEVMWGVGQNVGLPKPGHRAQQPGVGHTELERAAFDAGGQWRRFPS